MAIIQLNSYTRNTSKTVFGKVFLLVTNAGLYLLLTICLSCTGGETPMDWTQFYSETASNHWETPVGSLALSLSTPKSWNGQTWFFFHGAGGDSESWKGLIPKILTVRQYASHPRIVSFSMGSKWFLVDRTSKQRLAANTLFWNEILPFVKNRFARLGKTTALGHSMGGFNALSVFLDNPDFWDTVVLISPAVADLAPYASQTEKENYVRRMKRNTLRQWLKSFSKPDTRKIDGILGNWRNLVSDNQEWRRIDPLARLKNLDRRSNTRFFVTAGKKDPFGFSEGVMKISAILAEKGISVKYHISDGGHMALPQKEIAQFLNAG